MAEIIITKRAEGSFDVVAGDRRAEELTWEEMWGMVAQLTMPDGRPCLGWLKTEEQQWTASVKATTNEEVQPSRAFELTDRLLAELRKRYPGHELSVVQVPLWVHVRVGGKRFTTYVLKSDGDDEVIRRVVEYFERPVRPTGSEFEGVGTTTSAAKPGADGYVGSGEDYPVTGV